MAKEAGDLKVYFSNILIDDKFPVHSVYHELLKHPPIRYCNDPGWQAKKTKLSLLPLSTVANTLKLPNFWYTKVGADLFHANQHLVLNRKPWVVDIENVGGFVSFIWPRLDHAHTRWLIRKSLEGRRCKRIMPWTEAAKKSLLNTIPSKAIAEKTQVVYPAIEPMQRSRTRGAAKKEKVSILTVGRGYEKKGGEWALKAYERLLKKHDGLECTLILDVPQEVKKRYAGRKGLRILDPNIPRERLLKEHFAKADIFCLPTISDSFGMVFLEAMRHGLPIVTTEGFAREEIVEHGKNGLLVEGFPIKWFNKDCTHHPKYWDYLKIGPDLKEEWKAGMVDRLERALSPLIEDRKRREQLGREGLKLVETGKFSIERRNRILLDIYQEAV